MSAHLQQAVSFMPPVLFVHLASDKVYEFFEQALDYKPQQVRSNALQPSLSLSPRNAALPPPSGAAVASRGFTNGRRTGDTPAVGGPVATRTADTTSNQPGLSQPYSENATDKV